MFNCSEENSAYFDSGWHHVAMTYDGSETIAGIDIYFDGVLQPNAATGQNLNSSTVSTALMVIGDDRTGDPFHGLLDETRFYNRELTYADVQELYTGIPQPEVSTQEATPYASDSVTLNGYVEEFGDPAIETAGFQYGLDATYGATSTVEGLIESVDFSVVLDTLEPETTYHYRAFGSSSEALVYGADETFTTLRAPLTVEISSCEELQAIDDDGAAYYDTYQLTSDIDCTGVDFAPLEWDTYFMGIFRRNLSSCT